MRIILLFLLITMGHASTAVARIALSNVILDIPASGSRFADIEVTNLARETAYVETQIAEVLHPGTAREQRVPHVPARDQGLLVSPARMILPPQGRKNMRFLAPAPAGEQERVFRVTVRPVSGEAAKDSSATALKILVAYEVLVFLAPAQPSLKVHYERNENHLVATNRGNVNVLLHDLRQCPAAPNHTCEEAGGGRLYPGQTRTFTLPLNSPVEFLQTQAGQNTKLQH